MTPRQLQLLDFIRVRLENGVNPSYAEIAQGLGFANRSSAHQIVARLIEAGYLRRGPGHARSLELVERKDLRGTSSDALRAELARRGEAIELQREPLGHGRQATCAADTCGVAVQRGRLFCRHHWFKLPHSLRDEILRAHAARDARRYQALVAEARDIADGCGGPL